MAETAITDVVPSMQVRYFVSSVYLTDTEREPRKQWELGTLEGHADATAIPKLPNSTVSVATLEGLPFTTTCIVGSWEIPGDHVSESDTGHIVDDIEQAVARASPELPFPTS
jgi:hypothetical protein